MKNIFFFVSLFILLSSHLVVAQYEGKKFISGTAQINFNNSNPKSSAATNDYGYGIDLGFGKFKTNTMATGWNLSSSLGGRKYSLQTYENGALVNHDKSGVNMVTAGVGKFWQFYKHFNDNIGVFAGPNINLNYQNSKAYDLSTSQYIVETKSNVLTLSLGLNAGVYYNLSPRWWINASLGFSNPVSLTYVMTKNKNDNFLVDSKANAFTYNFTPSFTFPSVGFGVRYFLR